MGENELANISGMRQSSEKSELFPGVPWTWWCWGSCRRRQSSCFTGRGGVLSILRLPCTGKAGGMLCVQHPGLKAVSLGLSSVLLPISPPGPSAHSQPCAPCSSWWPPTNLPCRTHGFAVSPQVWPGLTAFADFSNPDTHQWWLENLQRFHAHVPFDGLWIVSPSLSPGSHLPAAWLVPSTCVLAGLSVPQMQLFQAYLLIPKTSPLKMLHDFLCLGHE